MSFKPFKQRKNNLSDAQKKLGKLCRIVHVNGIIENSARHDARRQFFSWTNDDCDSKLIWEKIRNLCDEIYKHLEKGAYGEDDYPWFNDIACIFKRLDCGNTTRRYQKILNFLLKNNCTDELLYQASSLINKNEKLALEYFGKALKQMTEKEMSCYVLEWFLSSENYFKLCRRYISKKNHEELPEDLMLKVLNSQLDKKQLFANNKPFSNIKKRKVSEITQRINTLVNCFLTKKTSSKSKFFKGNHGSKKDQNNMSYPIVRTPTKEV